MIFFWRNANRNHIESGLFLPNKKLSDFCFFDTIYWSKKKVNTRNHSFTQYIINYEITVHLSSKKKITDGPLEECIQTFYCLFFASERTVTYFNIVHLTNHIRTGPALCLKANYLNHFSRLNSLFGNSYQI